MSVKGHVYLRLQFTFRECSSGRVPQSMALRGDNIPEDVSGGSMLQRADSQQLHVNPLKDRSSSRAPQSMALRGDDIPNVYMGSMLQRAEGQKPQFKPKT